MEEKKPQKAPTDTPRQSSEVERLEALEWQVLDHEKQITWIIEVLCAHHAGMARGLGARSLAPQE